MDLKYFFLDKPKTRWMFEPIDGCSIGCKYCNAYTAAKRIGYIKNWQKWINPKFKFNEKIIRKEAENIIKYSKNLDFIFVCSTSDPFQNNDTSKIVIKSINILNEYGLTTRLLTKMKIPNEYYLVNPKLNEIGITITNINKKDDRILQLDELKNIGFYTMISMQPFNTDTNLNNLKIWINNIFVNHIVFGLLDNCKNDELIKGFDLSNIIYEHCQKYNIIFYNGSPKFHKYMIQKLLNEQGQKIK